MEGRGLPKKGKSGKKGQKSYTTSKKTFVGGRRACSQKGNRYFKRGSV